MNFSDYPAGYMLSQSHPLIVWEVNIMKRLNAFATLKFLLKYDLNYPIEWYMIDMYRIVSPHKQYVISSREYESTSLNNCLSFIPFCCGKFTFYTGFCLILRTIVRPRPDCYIRHWAARTLTTTFTFEASCTGTSIKSQCK